MAIATQQTQDERVSELVLQRRMLTPAQLEECKAIQGRGPTPMSLAQVIVAKRYATAEDLRALVQQGPRGTGVFQAQAGSGSGVGPAPTGSGVTARPTGTFEAAKLDQPSEDADVAFGRFLVQQGIITGDQVREAYRHLQTYRAQHPQVNLSQVLAKHGMCDKDRLRSAYQTFMAQRSGAPQASPMVAPAQPTPASGVNRGPDPRASAGSNPFFQEPPKAKPDDRFGYKTVELDPQERPDFDPRAAGGPGSGAFARPTPAAGPGSGAFPSPFGVPPGGAAPIVDPGALDAFLPLDSTPIGGNKAPGAGGWVESETLIDRPARASAAGSAPGTSPGVPAIRGTAPAVPAYRPTSPAFPAARGPAPTGPGSTNPGPGSSHGGPGQASGPGSTNPGPGQTNGQASGPGSTNGVENWGPRGTHAGPRSTHRQGAGGGPIRDDAKAFGLDLAPVQLPGPAVVGAPVEDDEDEDDEDDASVEPEAAPAKGGKKKGDTNVQSSTFGGARPRRRGEAKKPSGPPVPLLAGVAAVLVLGVCGVAFAVVSSHGRQKKKEEFLATAQGALEKGKPSLEEAIAQHLALPAALLQDGEVDAAGKKLDSALARSKARKAAQELLATLPKARDADERLAICGKAVEADPTYADALVARARAKYAVARSKAAASGAGGQRTNLTAASLMDLGEAINQEPDKPLAYVVKGQLLLLNRNDAEARMQAESALRAALGKDQGGALGELAQGLLAAVTDQLDPAIEAYTRALGLNPQLIDAYLARAQVRMKKREFGKALDDANEATKQDPTSADALTLQAEARYFSTGSSDRAGALQTLDKALKLDPSNPHALAVRAFVRLERDRIGDLVSTPEDRAASKRDAERAIAVFAEEPLAHLTLAEVAADTNPVEAKQHASRAIECGRHLVQTWLCRGRLRGKEADEYAIQDFEEVLKIAPTNAQALTNKAAVLFAARRDAEQATVLLDQAIQADAEIPWAYYWRGMIALAPPRNTQKYAQAVTDFSEAIARQPQFPDAYFRRACAYHDTGRYVDCLKDLQTAESQRSQSGSSASQGMFQQHWVELMRGHCLFFTRQYADAEVAYKKYRDKAPPGDKAMPGVMRRLEELRQLIAGEITAEQLSTEKSEVADDQNGPKRR